MQRDPLCPGDDDDRQSDSLNDSAAEKSRGAGSSELSRRLAEFERVYRAEFGAVAAYFARRSEEPQFVADLTADTFVAAIQSFDEYDPKQAGSRAWAISIARRVYARFRESDPRGQAAGARSSAQRLLDRAETKELMWWIDVERSSRELMERLAPMSALDREAVELVELCGMSPGEAARELGVSVGALRVRLVRTRARLRREGGGHG
jgi:RNA polymerase sigma-70 factor (ECF subfamily)